MRMEDQFDNERKILNEALAQNETQIRRLEVKSKNTEEQRKPFALGSEPIIFPRQFIQLNATLHLCSL